MSSRSTAVPSPADQRSRQPLSVWELPQLLKSVHEHRRVKSKRPKERPHYPALLAFIHRNRFAICSQLRRRFPDQLSSDRTARRHLAELQDLRYIDTALTLNTSPLWPKVYFVTRRGIRRLKEAYESQGKSWYATTYDRRRSEGQSAQHILHELFITEFLLIVWEAGQQQEDWNVLTMQRRSLGRHPAFKLPGSSRLIPDAMVLYRQEGAGMMCCFVEVDLGTMSVKQMAAKYDRYRRWALSDSAKGFLQTLYKNHGAQRPRAAFRVVSVIGTGDQRSDSKRIRALQREARKSACDAVAAGKIASAAAISKLIEAGQLLDLFSHRSNIAHKSGWLAER